MFHNPPDLLSRESSDRKYGADGSHFLVFQWQHGRIGGSADEKHLFPPNFADTFPAGSLPTVVLKTGAPFQPLAAGSCINRR